MSILIEQNLKFFLKEISQIISLVGFLIGLFIVLMGLAPLLSYIETAIMLVDHYSFIDGLEYTVLTLSSFDKIAMPIIIVALGLTIISFVSTLQKNLFPIKESNE